MKKPWLNFVGICSLVFAIVIFCVIFGGYSSLLRSQNRINAAKNYLADQSLIQLDQIDSLLALVPPGEDMAKTLNQTADKTNMIISKIKEAEMALQKEHEHLVRAMAEINTLSGLLPICASCKRIRDDKGYWNLLESYIETHSDAEFSHGICPDCSDRMYGDQDWYTPQRER